MHSANLGEANDNFSDEIENLNYRSATDQKSKDELSNESQTQVYAPANQQRKTETKPKNANDEFTMLLRDSQQNKKTSSLSNYY